MRKKIRIYALKFLIFLDLHFALNFIYFSFKYSHPDFQPQATMKWLKPLNVIKYSLYSIRRETAKWFTIPSFNFSASLIQISLPFKFNYTQIYAFSL